VRITQSTLGAADKCLLSFQYAMNRPAWAKQTASADRALGTGYHAGLAQYYTARMESNDVLPDKAAMITEACRIFDVSTTTDLYDNTPVERFLWTDKIPDADMAHGILTDLITAYVDNGWYWGHEWEVIAVELAVTVVDPVTGREFKLGCDAALRQPGKVMIVDHKSGGKQWAADKHQPRKQNQSPLYTWAAKHHFGVDEVDFAFDIITLPGPRTPVRFDRRITTPGVAVETAIVKKADDLMHLYETVHVQMGRDLPANPASNLCNPKWCDYWDGCPHGAALDDRPATGDELVYAPVKPEPTPTTIPDPHRNAKALSPTPSPSVVAMPDEGPTVDVDALRMRYTALDAASLSWVGEITTQALQAGLPIHLKDNLTARRARILDGLVTLAEGDADDDDAVRALCRHILDDDAVEWPTVPVGAVVGRLSATSAATFAAAAEMFVAGRFGLTFQLDGPALSEVAA
jgi:hypothetical protein